MHQVVDKFVYAMASLRFLSGAAEMTGGFLMLYFGTVPRALQVNGALALVGPFVLIAVTSIGVAGLSGDISIRRIAMLIVGVAFILYASKS